MARTDDHRGQYFIRNNNSSSVDVDDEQFHHRVHDCRFTRPRKNRERVSYKVVYRAVVGSCEILCRGAAALHFDPHLPLFHQVDILRYSLLSPGSTSASASTPNGAHNTHIIPTSIIESAQETFQDAIKPHQVSLSHSLNISLRRADMKSKRRSHE
ncbi:hypothetical protein BT96DRAFT_722296 [Gymnopus androsaceus JB14]|uniref:Uncharacterized protein n=1 Tax=Gymnopus androsaceus JB14 TaxID=1447944 RepID=A0A6A4HLV2_9AGAR|nr:hypothetical protein BT96DRAFT_722296 [Gymnopus androsaceus JB14]